VTRRVLITGAAGNIGSAYAKHAVDLFQLRLTDRPDSDVDTVVHLAATPDPTATWGELLPANITATYNVLVAAKAAGCRRVVLASSVHAVTGYPHDVQVRTTDPVNPGTLYGVTKCFGEALGRYMAEQECLSVVAVRIGDYGEPNERREPEGAEALDMFLSPGDLHRLLDACIESEHHWAIVHAVSDNAFTRLDMSASRELLGVEPRDKFESFNRGVPDDLNQHEDQSHQDGLQSGLRAELRRLT
jgi:dTDP-4-dehydrorhamnose reductase